jgi:glucose/arabinose dehydrogenase
MIRTNPVYRKAFLIFCLLMAGLSIHPLALYAADLPPCSERPHILFEPWVDGRLFCLELVINDPSVGALGFAALAVGDDGTLYAARPLTGEVYALDDSDGDRLPDSPRLYASGLERPNALTWHDGALYVAGGASIYRINDGAVAVLVDNVPSGSGFWNGGLIVEEDGSLIVATGAPCSSCTEQVNGRGGVLRLMPDGTREVLATGLRSPGDLAEYRNGLWVLDAAPEHAPELMDEINLIRPGADYGFPRCLQSDNASSTTCWDEAAPAVALPPGSQPRGLAAYRGDAISALEGALLVTLYGNRGGQLAGYQLLAVWLTGEGQSEQTYEVMPNGILDTERVGYAQFNNESLNLRGSGFYPRRPLDVAVSPEGWVYISVTDGWILALRGHER